MARAPSGAAVGASPEYTRTPVHGFPILLTELATIVRNTCTLLGVDDALPFTITAQSTLFFAARHGVCGELPGVTGTRNCDVQIANGNINDSRFRRGRTNDEFRECVNCPRISPIARLGIRISTEWKA